MGLWDLLFGGKRRQAPTEACQVELAPGLRVTITPHELETGSSRVACVTLVTEGLSRHGQKELVFTLRPPEAPYEPLLDLLRTVDRLAAEGRIVHAGDLTQLGRGLLRDDARGITYVRSTAIRGRPGAGAPALDCFLLLGDELRVYHEHGQARVLARLGHAARYFPYPPWSDLSRAATRADGPSVLDQVPRLRADGVFVRLREQEVWIRVREDARARLRGGLAQLPPEAPLALLTQLDDAAGACFTWTPGQREPAAITREGYSADSPIGACFLTLVPEQDHHEAMLTEDGVALFVPTASAQRLRELLVAGEGSLEAAPLRVHVAPVITRFDDPVDGRVLVADEWSVYRPSGAADADDGEGGGPVRLRETVLLTPERELSERVDVEPLATYLSRLARAVRPALASARSAQVHLRVELSATSPAALRLAARPEAPAANLERARSLAAAVGAPTVRGPVALQLVFDVTGADALGDRPPAGQGPGVGA